MADPRQYAWFGGILGCLAAFAVIGAWATVSLLSVHLIQSTADQVQYKCFVR